MLQDSAAIVIHLERAKKFQLKNVLARKTFTSSSELYSIGNNVDGGFINLRYSNDRVLRCDREETSKLWSKKSAGSV